MGVVTVDFSIGDMVSNGVKLRFTFKTTLIMLKNMLFISKIVLALCTIPFASNVYTKTGR